MLERTDFNLVGPIKGSVNTPLKYKLSVPPNRGNTTGGTRFFMTDGAGGLFKPKQKLLEEGESEFSFVYTPKQAGNLVLSIKSSDDHDAPFYITVTVTALKIVHDELVAGKPYRIRLTNPQALYSSDSQPITDAAGSITSVHFLDHHTVMIHGKLKSDATELVLTDTETDGVHKITIPVSSPESEEEDAPVVEKPVVDDEAVDEDDVDAEVEKNPEPTGDVTPSKGLIPEKQEIEDVTGEVHIPSENETLPEGKTDVNKVTSESDTVTTEPVTVNETPASDEKPATNETPDGSAV